MSLFRRNWTPAEADEWTKHDFWASFFAVCAYFLITVGTARALLLAWDGYVELAAGAVCTILMFKIIDPKLRVISSDYEEKQHAYLDELERKVRWEE